MLLVLQGTGISVTREQRRQEAKQSLQYSATFIHVVLRAAENTTNDVANSERYFVAVDVNRR